MTKRIGFDILCKLAYGIPRKSGPANLENDTEKKRANNKEKNERRFQRVKHESVKGLNGRV